MLALYTAGRDPKSQRRALATLQTTIVEHEQQVKDMEDRLATVSSFRLKCAEFCVMFHKLVYEILYVS
jgi:hypothetical protein